MSPSRRDTGGRPERDADAVVRDVAVVDPNGTVRAGRWDVLIRDRRIDAIKRAGIVTARTRVTVDGSGCTVLPGLTDAHVHFALIGPRGDHGSDSPLLHVLAVVAMIDGALDEGFTTVRDAGGLDPAWARAVAAGRLRGPRILPSGSVLSQTGGHGDLRAQHESASPGHSIPGLIARPEIVDGPDEVRRATREQLRRGATQIKLLASGGIVSPTDPFDSLQFSRDEIAAAVEAARNAGTYVAAHCHVSAAIDVAIEAGVRSIEHASILTRETARRIADHGAFIVPTLQALEMLATYPERWSLSPDKVALLRSVADQAAESIRIADEAGVLIGSGSDVVGPWQGRRGEEIVLKARVLGAAKAIESATRTNAALFNLGDRIGTVEVGKEADLILVAGDPLDRIELLAEPSSIPVVILGGRVVKDREGRVHEGPLLHGG
jgi:imidazolonepropionase-like amidohydrolase